MDTVSFFETFESVKADGKLLQSISFLGKIGVYESLWTRWNTYITSPEFQQLDSNPYHFFFSRMKVVQEDRGVGKLEKALNIRMNLMMTNSIKELLDSNIYDLKNCRGYLATIGQ